MLQIDIIEDLRDKMLLINGWIYYKDPSNGNYYKIRTDGKYHQEWN